MTLAWLQPSVAPYFPLQYSQLLTSQDLKNLILAELWICPTASPFLWSGRFPILWRQSALCVEKSSPASFAHIETVYRIMLKTLWTKYTACPVFLVFPSRDTSWWRITTLGEKIQPCVESFFFHDGSLLSSVTSLPLLASSPHPVSPSAPCTSHCEPPAAHPLPVLFLASALHGQFSLSESTFIACLQSTRHYVKRFTCFNSAIRIIL